MKQSLHQLLLALIRAQTSDELLSAIEAAEAFLDDHPPTPELADALDNGHYRYFVQGSAAPPGSLATPPMSDAECEAAWDDTCRLITRH